MAEQSYPFENQSTSETQYSALFRLLADTGVNGASTSSDLRPYGDSTGMFVKVPAGAAVVRGFYYTNDTPLTLPVAAAGGTQRVDSVVLRLDPAANTITATVKQGTATAPALTQTDAGLWEVRLADVTVPAGTTTVTAGQVADRRAYTSLPWGKWTTDQRPTAARGKAGYNETTGQPEWSDGNGWRPFAQTTTDASQLTAGQLANARLPYGAVAAVRGDRPVDAPTDQYGIVNGDWNQVLQPGSYRVWAGNTNQNTPPGAYLYGTLVVYGAGPNVESRTQHYYEHAGSRSYWRTAWNGTDWQTWFIAVGVNDLNAVRGEFANRTVNTAGAAKMAAGTALVSSLTAANGQYSGYVDVTWPAMTLTSVVATAQSADNRGVTAEVSNQTSTGCRVTVVRANNAATGVNWVAVGT